MAQKATTNEQTAAGAPAQSLNELRDEIGRTRDTRRLYLLCLAAFLSAPSLIGVAIIVLVLAEIASDAVLDSGAATSTALVVGAVLILVPPALFNPNPGRYTEHLTDIENRLSELFDRFPEG